MANLSIYGLTLLYDGTGTIFDELVLPAQLTSDPSIITDRLLLDTMELEVLYADPDVFKGALGIYSKSRLQSWQKIADAMYKAYDPYINFTRDESRVNTITRNLSDTRTDNLSFGNTRDTKRNAWDGSTVGTMTPGEQVTDSGTNTGTVSNAQSGTLTTEDHFHSQGDSALFTPTDIAKKEFELRAEHSLIEYILYDLKSHFCLLVY